MSKYTEHELIEQFKNDIDESLPMVEIFGMRYDPSRVLEEVDPIAFRVGFNDWLDGLENCEDCDNHPIDCECEEE